MNKKLVVLVAMGLLAAPMMANAGLLGASVDVEFFFPDSSTFFCSIGSATVGGAVEYPAGCPGFSRVSIDISDTQVIVVLAEGAFTSASFNGFVMSILSGPTILSVAFDGGSSTMGVTSFGFDATSMNFNFASQLPGTSVFNIGTSTVPEPATLALLGLGLVGLGFGRRRSSSVDCR